MTEYNFERQPNETPFKQLKRISIDKVNKLHNMDWLDVKEQFNFDQSAETLRKYAAGWKMDDDNDFNVDSHSVVGSVKYKEVTEILNDGSHKSDKLISMSTEQSKDSKYLLEAHGFDVNEWIVTNAKNSIWNMSSKETEARTLFSSKITVKPSTSGFNMDRFLEVVKQEVKPITIKASTKGDKLLEIPLFDMHFGIADMAYYSQTYSRIKDMIENKDWDMILFIIGQDLFHNDGFTGKTTSGTMIDKVDMEKAWSDADLFYTGLISVALANSKNVDVIYSNGNHDQGISYGFVKTLEVKFPQVTFDNKMQQRKGYSWKNVFIGATHGDKGSSRVVKNFLREYRQEIAKADVVEIHSGHYHHEVTKDDLGVVHRSLATKAKTDLYHYENGFTGAMKRFQLFEYSSDSLDANYYV